VPETALVTVVCSYYAFSEGDRKNQKGLIDVNRADGEQTTPILYHSMISEVVRGIGTAHFHTAQT